MKCIISAYKKMFGTNKENDEVRHISLKEDVWDQ